MSSTGNLPPAYGLAAPFRAMRRLWRHLLNVRLCSPNRASNQNQDLSLPPILTGAIAGCIAAEGSDAASMVGSAANSDWEAKERRRFALEMAVRTEGQAGAGGIVKAALSFDVFLSGDAEASQ